MNTLDRTFSILSPRLRPRRLTLASIVVNGVAMATFLMLIAQAFRQQGLAMWSVGIAYILYDTALLFFTAWQIRALTASPPESQTLVDAPGLTVIVAAFNEAAVLPFTVERLAGQDMAPEVILIADDGSSDDTAQVMQDLYGLDLPALGDVSEVSPVVPSLRWLRLPRGGKAIALNRALERIDTELMLTVDADTLLAPGSLKAMRETFALDASVVAATGVLVPACGPQPMGRLFQWFQRYEYVRNFLSRHAWMQLNCLLLISGAFAAFRTAAVIEVGGFDAECLVEDYELIHRLQRVGRDTRRGWTTRVVGNAVAITDAPASPLAFLRQRRRWFGGFLQTQFWNRDMVGNRRYGWLGLAMLPVKALDTLQPIYGLAAVCILFWLVVTDTALVAVPIFLIMMAKIILDLTFHLWSLRRYADWTGQRDGLRMGPALVASLLEPFSFQLLRHAGAAWGWYAFLTGRSTWGRQTRTAIGVMAAQP